MIAVTILAVIYINLQVQIYDLAYQARKKENQLRKITDRNGSTIYSILKLKSANHLGVTLLAENSNMQFIGNSDIVKLETSIPLKNTEHPSTALGIENKPNLLVSIFSLKSQAEAKQ